MYCSPLLTLYLFLVQEEMAVHKDKEWPNKEECDTYVQKFPAYNEYPTTYLPAENNGLRVSTLHNIQYPTTYLPAENKGFE